MKYIYGPVPSRRLGISLGVSPIPKKTCNYSCIYCQLGRTTHMTNTRKMFYNIKDIIRELHNVFRKNIYFDVVTIVGEGEPTLYLGLGDLISEIKKRTDKTVAVITNSALLYDKDVRKNLYKADIVLPSMDAYDEDMFNKICRPYKGIQFRDVRKGLEIFSNEYQGKLWIEIMLMKGINDDEKSLVKYVNMLNHIKYDKLYLNTPVRPPAESNIESIEFTVMKTAVNLLNGISLDLLKSIGFHSEIKDHYQAVISIITRHPMNQFEIEEFLNTRNCKNKDGIFNRLKIDENVIEINYKGYRTFRIR